MRGVILGSAAACLLAFTAEGRYWGSANMKGRTSFLCVCPCYCSGVRVLPAALAGPRLPGWRVHCYEFLTCLSRLSVLS
jgi:hypothetical protein